MTCLLILLHACLSACHHFLSSLTKQSRVLATQNLQQHNFGEILNRWGKYLSSGKTLVYPGSLDRWNKGESWQMHPILGKHCSLSVFKISQKRERKLNIMILTWTSLYRRRAWGYNPSYRHDPPWYASLHWHSSCKKCWKVWKPVPWQNAGTLKECYI